MPITGFYTLLNSELTVSQVNAYIKLNEAHPIFQGHFPGNPVTPGVCMLQIFKELVEKAVQRPLQIRSCKSVKFTALINPFTDPELYISLHINPENDDAYKILGSAYFGETQAIKLSAVFTS